MLAVAGGTNAVGAAAKSARDLVEDRANCANTWVRDGPRAGRVVAVHSRMLVFRSFAIGLSAACFALLVMRPTVELRVTEAPALATVAPRLGAARRDAVPVMPTIVDAAPGITPAQLALTIRLQPGEQIASVDDVAVTSDLSAGILLASRNLSARRYIDLGVVGPAGERRVIVLLH